MLRPPMLRPLALAVLLLPLAASAQHAGHDMATAGTDAGPAASLILGRIDVRTSATGAAAREIETGMLALHSFWYEEARDHFQAAQRSDPGAALALWGEAATHDHPLWGQHDSTAARTVFARADSLRAAGALHADAREAAFLDALGVLVRPGGSLAARRDRYAAALQRLAGQDPTDDEAAVFAALAAMSQQSYDPDDPARVVPVAAALEDVAQKNPQHPGAQHILIHAYDAAAFAPLGLRAARVYAGLAPAASHALHMPSHIFRMLGLWPQMEASNRAAWAASVAWQERTHRRVAARDYHALTWLHTALLRQGRFAEARAVVATAEADAALAAARGEAPGPPAQTVHTLRADALVEAEAAGLPARSEPVAVSPDSLSPAAAYAFAVEAVYAGQDAWLDAALARLTDVAETSVSGYAGDVRASDVRAGVAEVQGWRRQRAGDLAGAEALARESVRLTAAAHPLSPPTSSAHMLLADVLLARGDAAAAHALYAAAAAAAPSRASMLLGLARASAAVGDDAAARDAYTCLLAVWADADAGLPAAAEARAALGAGAAR